MWGCEGKNNIRYPVSETEQEGQKKPSWAVRNWKGTDSLLGAVHRVTDSGGSASFVLRENVTSFLQASRLYSKDGGSKFLGSFRNNLKETAVT
jgi:hypothetical protein